MISAAASNSSRRRRRVAPRWELRALLIRAFVKCVAQLLVAALQAAGLTVEHLCAAALRPGLLPGTAQHRAGVLQLLERLPLGGPGTRDLGPGSGRPFPASAGQ